MLSAVSVSNGMAGIYWTPGNMNGHNVLHSCRYSDDSKVTTQHKLNGTFSYMLQRERERERVCAPAALAVPLKRQSQQRAPDCHQNGRAFNSRCPASTPGPCSGKRAPAEDDIGWKSMEKLQDLFSVGRTAAELVSLEL